VFGASLAHGQWLPWLKAQQESGAIEFTERTASRYIRVASNRTRVSDSENSPSIRAALELLTDKDESPAHTGNR
jgi:predicted metal-dependent hydrolase